MTITITPSKLAGTIAPPPSKSQAHRAIIAACLGGGTVHNLAQSQDIIATQRCMAALTASTGELPLLDCGESGSTLRFLVPIALTLGQGAKFTGQGRLLDRPMTPYADAFAKQGIALVPSQEGDTKFLTVQGKLKSGTFVFPGDVSSQFITGMLYALPLLEGDSELLLSSPLESKGYVDMTLEVLKRFHIHVENQNYLRFVIPGGQTYTKETITVESDYSQAAFYLVAQAIGSDLTITGMNPASVQGDMAILDFVTEATEKGELFWDVSQCPDLVPILGVLASMREGQTTHIVNAARLRIKESDRLDTVTTELCKLGGQITQTPDSLTIQGISSFTGGQVTAHNDHRIAMMLAMAATQATGPVVLEGSHCVAKSYPNFWEDYGKLGGIVK